MLHLHKEHFCLGEKQHAGERHDTTLTSETNTAREKVLNNQAAFILLPIPVFHPRLIGELVIKIKRFFSRTSRNAGEN